MYKQESAVAYVYATSNILIRAAGKEAGIVANTFGEVVPHPQSDLSVYFFSEGGAIVIFSLYAYGILRLKKYLNVYLVWVDNSEHNEPFFNNR